MQNKGNVFKYSVCTNEHVYGHSTWLRVLPLKEIQGLNVQTHTHVIRRFQERFPSITEKRTQFTNVSGAPISQENLRGGAALIKDGSPGPAVALSPVSLI